MKNNSNIIGKKNQTIFYGPISQKNKLHSNYKIKKNTEMIINYNPTPNKNQDIINKFCQQYNDKYYSKYLIDNFNYLLKQNTQHKTNYKLSIAPHLNKISLEKLYSSNNDILNEQLRININGVYKNKIINYNNTYLNEYMFRDQNNNWVIKKNNDLTKEEKIDIINIDNNWYHEKIKEAHRQGFNKFVSKRSIVKTDNIITFTRTSLEKQGMISKNIDIIQKEWIITVKNYLIKDLGDDLRGLYLHMDEKNPHFHYHFLPRNSEQTITSDMKNYQEKVQIHPKGKIGSKGIITKKRLVQINNDLRELFTHNIILKNIDWSRLNKYELELLHNNYYNKYLYMHKQIKQSKKTLLYINQKKYEIFLKKMTNKELNSYEENIKQEVDWKLNIIYEIKKQREQIQKQKFILKKEQKK